MLTDERDILERCDEYTKKKWIISWSMQEELIYEIKRLRQDVSLLRGIIDGQNEGPAYWVLKLDRECETLRSELARYQTPNVDNIEVINERP